MSNEETPLKQLLNQDGAAERLERVFVPDLRRAYDLAWPDAEDLFHNTLIEALATDKGRPVTALYSFLWTIAQRLRATALGAQRLHKDLERDLELQLDPVHQVSLTRGWDDDATDPDEDHSDVEDRGRDSSVDVFYDEIDTSPPRGEPRPWIRGDPERYLLRRERNRIKRNVGRRVPSILTSGKARAVIADRFLSTEELTNAEIADRHNISERTLGRVLRASLDELRKFLSARGVSYEGCVFDYTDATMLWLRSLGLKVTA